VKWNINWTLVVEAIKALAWPLFAAFALYLLRRPLVELVAQLIRRAKKVSVFEVSVELAILPELQSSWSVGDADPRRLSSSMIFDNPSQPLFQELLKPAQADYAIVNLSSGQAWLTSRLFIFSLILGEVTGLRAFVFLESAANTRRKFLGVATPSNVRLALGRRYPWFEEAFAQALASEYPKVTDGDKPKKSTFCNKPSLFAPAEHTRVSSLVKGFVQNVQRSTDPPANECHSYLEVGTDPKTFERAHWIDGGRLEDDLVGVLEYAWVDESPDSPRRLISEAVIRRNSSFVALVDTDRRFVGLIDRHALISQMAIAGNNVGGADRGT